MFEKPLSEQESPADTRSERWSQTRFGEYLWYANQVYPSDLNDAEWALLALLLPPAKPHGRPRTVEIQRSMNGLFYLLRSGCAWRYVPKENGPWQTIYWDFPAMTAEWDGDQDAWAVT